MEKFKNIICKDIKYKRGHTVVLFDGVPEDINYTGIKQKLGELQREPGTL